jgi:hypothetical protein
MGIRLSMTKSLLRSSSKKTLLGPAGPSKKMKESEDGRPHATGRSQNGLDILYPR